MFHQLTVPTLGLLWLSLAAATPDQSPARPAGEPIAPDLRTRPGDDARQAADLDKAIKAALKADRWDDAIARAEERLALQARARGPKHFETVSAEWVLKALRRVAPMSSGDRIAYRSAKTMTEQAEILSAQGKYAQAQPLFEKVLETYRRLLGDDHPETAFSYENVAIDLAHQGKYAAAQPLFEKAFGILRRRLGEVHPDTAQVTKNMAANHDAQDNDLEARDRRLRAVRSLDAARLRVAFTGL
jgi:tetratricopeptide (TPR) repeat protein